MKWISVKERLPNKSGKYLCYTENGFMSTFKFSKNLYNVNKYDFPKNKYKGKCGWYASDREYGYCEVENVAYWIPLPEPPKVGENDV